MCVCVFLVTSLEPTVCLRERKRKKVARAFCVLMGMHCEDGGHGTWRLGYTFSFLLGTGCLDGLREEMDGAWFAGRGSLLCVFLGSKVFF